MLNGVKWIFTVRCGAKSSAGHHGFYSIASKYWCRTQRDIRKRCPLHVNISFIERKNVPVKSKRGPERVLVGRPCLGQNKQVSCGDTFISYCSQKRVFHRGPWAPPYRRHGGKQMGDEARPRHQLFCCLEEIFANILIRSDCTTGNLTFHIMLIRASTFFHKNTAANQKFCGEQQQNGDVVNSCINQWFSGGWGWGGGCNWCGNGINWWHWWQEVVAGLNLERKEVAMCHLNSSLTHYELLLLLLFCQV